MSDRPGKPQKPVANKNKMAKVHCVIHREEKAGGKQVILPSPLQNIHDRTPKQFIPLAIPENLRKPCPHRSQN